MTTASPVVHNPISLAELAIDTTTTIGVAIGQTLQEFNQVEACLIAKKNSIQHVVEAVEYGKPKICNMMV
ncbi:hypothetical protein L195_g051052 [Trifolium pratense]|uniref:Uncharacterized protein n=1 Tax=Trifolium pratense TaxID=57577 RepID=A0A2K3JXD3_TRIPR|nr:hypothetical protein L195_g051052 [Trifolium pratense]